MGTFRGLFEGFSNHVQHQLGIRKELMKIGRFTGQPENFFTYTVEKKCILRLSSGVDIEENNTLLTEDDTLLDKDGNPFILTAENLARSYI